MSIAVKVEAGSKARARATLKCGWRARLLRRNSNREQRSKNIEGELRLSTQPAMRRCLVHHPRRYAGARPVRLRNDDELDAAIGESPDYQYGLAAPGVERIVDPPLDRVFVGSLSLFRGTPG